MAVAINDKYFVTKRECEYAANKLYHKIVFTNAIKHIKSVTFVADGGLWAGKYMANILNSPLYKIEASSYDENNNRTTPTISYMPNIDFSTTLLIDDIVDSGHTYNSILLYEPTIIWTASLFIRKSMMKNSIIWPVFYGSQLPETWAIFPWEKN